MKIVLYSIRQEFQQYVNFIKSRSIFYFITSATKFKLTKKVVNNTSTVKFFFINKQFSFLCQIKKAQTADKVKFYLNVVDCSE